MAYTPYYSGGWQSGSEGGTPITPAALNNMESGIGNAVEKTGDTMTGALTRNVNQDFDTPPAFAEWNQIIPITDDDNAVRGGVYMVRNTNGSYQTIYGVFKAGVGWNYIAPRINADDSFGYDVNQPAALKSAIGLANANNPVVLTSADDTVAEIYAKLSALPISPTDGAGVTCWISAAAMNLLTGGKVTSSELTGVIVRTSDTGYRIFGMYGLTGFMMYWGVTVTSTAITPNTVYRLQGTAM